MVCLASVDIVRLQTEGEGKPNSGNCQNIFRHGENTCRKGHFKYLNRRPHTHTKNTELSLYMTCNVTYSYWIYEFSTISMHRKTKHTKQNGLEEKEIISLLNFDQLHVFFCIHFFVSILANYFSLVAY